MYNFWRDLQVWDEIDNNEKCHYLSLFLTVIIILSAINIK